MKQGLTIQQLSQELIRQKDAKRDFIAPAQSMSVEDGRVLTITREEDGAMEAFGMTDGFHRQLGSALKIPAVYYDRMQEVMPGLLSDNVNAWLAQRDSRQMVRTLDGQARAFLSERYERIDHFDIAMATLPILQDLGEISFESTQITETRMYIKAVNPRLETDVVPGDTVQAGILISNSETGHGSVQVAPMLLRLVCSNGMVANDLGQRRKHVGRASMENWELFSTETQRADDHAFMLKLRDIVKAAVDETRFHMVVDKLREATGHKMTGRVQDVVELTAKQYGFGVEEQDNILEHLSRGGDFTQYGLSNAVTRAAQDVDSYDRSTELETVGWDIATMTPALWKRLNEAQPVTEVA